MIKKSSKIDYYVCSTPNKPIVYVLHGENGDMLVDTGLDTTVGEVEKWLDENDFDIKWIFLTHGHFDHTYNTKFFKDKYGAKVILHEFDLDLYYGIECPTLLPTSQRNITAANMANQDARSVTVPLCAIDYPVTDNDTELLKTLGFDAEIVMLHGHTAGSMGIKQGKVLYCGDACAAIGGDYFTSLFGSDLGALFRTEEKIFAINPLVIAPGHGKLIINEKAFPAK